MAYYDCCFLQNDRATYFQLLIFLIKADTGERLQVNSLYCLIADNKGKGCEELVCPIKQRCVQGFCICLPGFHCQVCSILSCSRVFVVSMGFARAFRVGWLAKSGQLFRQRTTVCGSCFFTQGFGVLICFESVYYRAFDNVVVQCVSSFSVCQSTNADI